MKNIKFWSNNIIRIDSIYKMNLLNSFKAPKIDNISVNICFRSAIENPKTILYPITAIKLITNQKPVICKAKKSIATFKLRKGMLIGAKVTLRKNVAYNFLSLFVLLVLPNIKELNFKKLNNKSSLSIGMRNLLIFPQLANYYEKFPKNLGAIININIKCQEPKLSNLYLTGFQLPVLNENMLSK